VVKQLDLPEARKIFSYIRDQLIGKTFPEGNFDSCAWFKNSKGNWQLTSDVGIVCEVLEDGLKIIDRNGKNKIHYWIDS
jgi:hypothetical protein